MRVQYPKCVLVNIWNSMGFKNGVSTITEVSLDIRMKSIGSKTEVPRDKSGNKTSSGEIGLNIRTDASPKVRQDQVSEGVSVLCWHAASVANVLWKPRTIRQKVIFGNKVQISNWCNVLSMEGVTVYGHSPVCPVTFRRGDLILFDTIPYRP